MPTVKLPIGTRRHSLLFTFMDYLIDIFRNPEYKLHRRIVILSIFVFGYPLLIFPYQTMIISLIILSICILIICNTYIKLSKENILKIKFPFPNVVFNDSGNKVIIYDPLSELQEDGKVYTYVKTNESGDKIIICDTPSSEIQDDTIVQIYDSKEKIDDYLDQQKSNITIDENGKEKVTVYMYDLEDNNYNLSKILVYESDKKEDIDKYGYGISIPDNGNIKQ